MVLVDDGFTLPPKVRGEQVGTITFQLQNVEIFQNRRLSAHKTNDNKNAVCGGGGVSSSSIQLHGNELTSLEDYSRDIYCQFQFWGDESVFEIQNCCYKRECGPKNNNACRPKAQCDGSSQWKKSFPIVGSILNLKHYFRDMNMLQLLLLYKNKQSSSEEEKDNQNKDSSSCVLGYSFLNLSEVLKHLIDTLEAFDGNGSSSTGETDFVESCHQINASIRTSSSCCNNSRDESCEEMKIIGDVQVGVMLRINIKDQLRIIAVTKQVASINNQQPAVTIKCSGHPELVKNGEIKNGTSADQSWRNISFDYGGFESFSLSPTSGDMDEDSILLNALFDTNISSEGSLGINARWLHSLADETGKCSLPRKKVRTLSQPFGESQSSKHSSSTQQGTRTTIGQGRIRKKFTIQSIGPNSSNNETILEKSKIKRPNVQNPECESTLKSDMSFSNNVHELVGVLDASPTKCEVNKNVKTSKVLADSNLNECILGQFEHRSKDTIGYQENDKDESRSLWVHLELSQFNLGPPHYFIKPDHANANPHEKMIIRISTSLGTSVHDPFSKKECPTNNHLTTEASGSASNKAIKERIVDVKCCEDGRKERKLILGINETFSWNLPTECIEWKQDQAGATCFPELTIECWICSYDDRRTSESNNDPREFNCSGIAKIPFLPSVNVEQISLLQTVPWIEFNQRIRLHYSCCQNIHVSTAALVCIGPLKNIQCLSKVRKAIHCIKRWWCALSQGLNMKATNKSDYNGRNDLLDIAACIIQKKWREQKHTQQPKVNLAKKKRKESERAVPFISRYQQEMDFSGSSTWTNMETDGHISPIARCTTHQSSSSPDEHSVINTIGQKVSIKICKVNGIKEIITLWLENESAFDLKSNDSSHDSFYTAGVMVAFEIMSKESQNSKEYTKQFCTSKILNLENIIEENDFDCSAMICFDASNEMLNYAGSESLIIDLWFVPIVTEIMQSQFPTVSSAKYNLPDGSKQVCYAKCPMKAISSVANVTQFCCPWIVPLTRGSSNTEQMGEIYIAFEALGKSNGKEFLSINLCSTNLEECLSNYQSIENTFTNKDSVPLDLIRNNVVDEERKRKTTTDAMSTIPTTSLPNDIYLNSSTSHEHSSTADKSFQDYGAVSVSHSHSKINSSVGIDNTYCEEGRESENVDSCSDHFDLFSCRNLSAVLASLDIVTSRMRDAFEESNENQLPDIKTSTTTSPSMNHDKSIEEEKSCIDEEYKALTTCERENLEKSKKAPFTTVLSSLENISVAVEQIGRKKEIVNSKHSECEEQEDSGYSRNDADSIATIQSYDSSSQSHYSFKLKEASTGTKRKKYSDSATQPSHVCSSGCNVKMVHKAVDESLNDSASAFLSLNIRKCYDMDSEIDSESSTSGNSVTIRCLSSDEIITRSTLTENDFVHQGKQEEDSFSSIDSFNVIQTNFAAEDELGARAINIMGLWEESDVSVSIGLDSDSDSDG